MRPPHCSLVAALPLLAACGGAPFEIAPDTGDGGDPGVPPTSDAASRGDAPADTGAPSPPSDASDAASVEAAPPPTDSGPPPCPSPADAMHGVFASAAATATAGCGAIDAPCATIAAALANGAALGKTRVYLDKGTYGEHVDLPAGVTLSGGWIYSGASSWTQQCTGDTRALAVIASPTAIGASIAAGSGTLETLTVRSKATALPGESLYGVFATGGADLTLRDVVVVASSGGTGAQGIVGPAPSGPVAPCAAGDGKAAASAPSNGKPQASSYASTGFVPGDGAPGAAGASGDNGTAAPTPTVAAKNCVSVPACSADQASCVDSGAIACGHAGTNGCGGPGGAAGLGGGGGGASIGVFAWGATVTMGAGRITAGSGGAGGSGVAGAAAPTSWTNMNGALGGTTAPSESCIVNSNGCGTAPKAITVTAPGAGGAGGLGAGGSAGASGAGGDSYSYYVGPGGSVTVSSLASLTFGSPGASSGPVPGAAGHAGLSN